MQIKRTERRSTKCSAHATPKGGQGSGNCKRDGPRNGDGTGVGTGRAELRNGDWTERETGGGTGDGTGGQVRSSELGW